jgi:phosphoglycolate phosphatase
VAKLILFDIDGTLILTGGAGGRAMTRAFADVFGVPDAFDGVPFPGRTDARILHDAFVKHEIDNRPDHPRLFRVRYLEQLVTEIELPHPEKRVLPGVIPLLDVLAARNDVHLGLLSGNYSDAAQIKLGHFGLWHRFGAGAFGDDELDRNALVPVAVDRARRIGVSICAMNDVVVIGDTPHDVACAQASGAVAIAVATGGFSVDELKEIGADLVVPDLAHTDKLLSAIMAEAPGSRTQPPRNAGSDRF